MLPVTREREQVFDGRLGLRDDRLRRSAASHGDDHDLARAREQACDVTCDRRLAHALAAPDHGKCGNVEWLELDGIQTEVGADVRHPGSEHAARDAKAAARIEHRLV